MNKAELLQYIVRTLTGDAFGVAEITQDYDSPESFLYNEYAITWHDVPDGDMTPIGAYVEIRDGLTRPPAWPEHISWTSNGDYMDNWGVYLFRDEGLLFLNGCPMEFNGVGSWAFKYEPPVLKLVG